MTIPRTLGGPRSLLHMQHAPAQWRREDQARATACLLAVPPFARWADGHARLDARQHHIELGN